MGVRPTGSSRFAEVPFEDIHQHRETELPAQDQVDSRVAETGSGPRQPPGQNPVPHVEQLGDSGASGEVQGIQPQVRIVARSSVVSSLGVMKSTVR